MLQHNVSFEVNILEMFEHSPTVSFQTIPNQVRTSQMQVWKTCHDFCLYPSVTQAVEALQPSYLLYM